MREYPVLYLSIAVIMAVVFSIICIAFLLDSYQKRKRSGRPNLFREQDEVYEQWESKNDFKSV